MERALGIFMEPAARVLTEVLNGFLGKKDNNSGNQAAADERKLILDQFIFFDYVFV